MAEKCQPGRNLFSPEMGRAVAEYFKKNGFPSIVVRDRKGSLHSSDHRELCVCDLLHLAFDGFELLRHPF